MRLMRATGVAAVVFFGAIMPAYAMQGHPDEDQGKAEKQQGKSEKAGKGRDERGGQLARQASPQGEQQQPQQGQRQADRPQQQERYRQAVEQPAHTRQQAASWQQQNGWAGQGAWQSHSTWQQGCAQRRESEHRNWAQRGGYGGYHIPEARFSVSFGSQHWFRMRSRPTMYMGYPRFSYGGYSFLLVDPWPEGWSDDWDKTDDVYIDYDDGYYPYNRGYPYVRLAITVST